MGRAVQCVGQVPYCMYGCIMAHDNVMCRASYGMYVLLYCIYLSGPGQCYVGECMC